MDVSAQYEAAAQLHVSKNSWSIGIVIPQINPNSNQVISQLSYHKSVMNSIESLWLLV